MHIIRITDPQAWDRALLALPNPHVLQSWAWGDFKERHGWTATRLLFQEGARTVAAASLLQRRLWLLPLSILYVPKGPILDWADTVLAAQVLAELERLARGRRGIFLKIDPDVYYPEEVPAFSGRATNAPIMARMLEAKRWFFSGDQIQFRNTVLLDIKRPEEDLLAAMKQKTRYNVRLAVRHGVAVRSGTASDLPLFYDLYAETARRDGFPIRPPAYYWDGWQSFLEAGRAHLLLAEVEGEPVAGLMLFTFGETAWYMYGASSDRYREHMPNYLLQWAAICRAREAGCTLYDLWGAPDRLHESDPMWGVVRFKLGLGGHVARGLGAWDFAVSRAAYRLYTVVIPGYLGWLRKMSGGYVRRRRQLEPVQVRGSRLGNHDSGSEM